MPQKPLFKTTVQLNAGGAGQALIVVSGPIDERSDFAPAGAELFRSKTSGIKKIVFDLSGVDQLNSIGVKKWISFLESVRPSFALQFDKISEMIVSQANVISSMLGPPGTPVLAFAAPYMCGSCEKEFSRMLKQADLSDNGEGGFTAPTLSCADCGGSLTFDEYEEEYFFFLKRSQGA